ncbi:hypothetical protein [Catenovulum agarivorans]|uniref:hypothetical protein n=1 Tax=Catenovulum agarivorans TaxID=1172192 RepID=UPI0002E89CA6|nr:hypothetical protein [Catenovulum agarivorans]
MTDRFNGSDDPIAIEASRLLEAKQFTKSAIFTKLFVYLVNSTLNNEVPKEISIGVEVFGKDTSYDPSNDSLVRVYVHKLRKKIDDIYNADKERQISARLSIPKGGYEVILTPTDQVEATETRWGLSDIKQIHRRTWIIIALSVLLLLSWTSNFLQYSNKPTMNNPANLFWSEFGKNKKLTYVVLGDLYLFHYREPNSNVRFLARNPKVNSDEGFTHWLKEFDESSGNISKTSNRFLMQSSAYTLTKVTKMLELNGIKYEITTLSDLDPKVLRDTNFIYLGMYKTMGILGSYFETSNYFCEEDCQKSLSDKNQNKYRRVGNVQGEHMDFGVVAKLNRDNGTLGLFLTGFTDTGIMQATRAVTYASDFEILKNALEANSLNLQASFDVLYEVNGYDYADYKSEIKQVLEISEGAL